MAKIMTPNVSHIYKQVPAKSYPEMISDIYYLSRGIIESYENNIKRTFGGLSYNGCMEMNDNYGSQGDLETLYWNTFGDPSFEVRSNYPQPINASHSNVIILGSSELSIQTNSSINKNNTNYFGRIIIIFPEFITLVGT